MVVYELFRWRAPPVVVLAVLLLAFNKHISDEEARNCPNFTVLFCKLECVCVCASYSPCVTHVNQLCAFSLINKAVPVLQAHKFCEVFAGVGVITQTLREAPF